MTTSLITVVYHLHIRMKKHFCSKVSHSTFLMYQIAIQKKKQFLVNMANDSDIDEKPPVINERESLIFD